MYAGMVINRDHHLQLLTLLNASRPYTDYVNYYLQGAHARVLSKSKRSTLV